MDILVNEIDWQLDRFGEDLSRESTWQTGLLAPDVSPQH